MANVSCNTINDLLPLYLDGALSEDSEGLVKEHLDGCAACGAVYHELKDTKLPIQQGRAAADKRTFKGIQRKIRRKRLLTACIAAGLVVILTFGIYFFLAVMEFYVPYEKSGLFMDGNVLKVKNNHQCAYWGCSPDGSTVFVYLTATKTQEGTPISAYSYSFPKPSLKEAITEQILFSMDEIEPSAQLDEQGNVVQVFDPPTALYYVSRQYAHKLSGGSYWMDEDSSEEEKLRELIEGSTLIWKAE